MDAPSASDYVGRPSPLYFAERLTEHLGGAKIYFKREDLNHTGAHKVNNVLGQIMLARRMGKPRIIAETGAGMHGVATATLCAKFGLECIVYMGAVDVDAAGAERVAHAERSARRCVPVESGAKTLKDAMNEALRDWVTNVADTFYCIGTVAGPHPYPMMVRDFQCVIGNETREQMHGGGRPSAGFADRLHRRRLQRDGAVSSVPRRHGRGDLRRRSGRPRARRGCTPRRSRAAAPACCTATALILLMDADGQIQEAHSISAGLDYPGIGPEHSWLNDIEPREISVRDRRRSARRVSVMQPARRHHSGARAGACAREGDGPRAKTAEGSPDGAQHVRPRRQGSRQRRRASGRQADDLAYRKAFRRTESSEGRAALVTFTMAGDPDYATSLAIAKALPKAGADVLELGMPFTDPMADGPADSGGGPARAAAPART